MNEIFEIDYENPKEVLVSDDKNLPIEKWFKKKPIGFFKFNDGMIIYVNDGELAYPYWQQIPEKKFRPLSWEEALPILEKAWINNSRDRNGWGKVININLEKKEFLCRQGDYFCLYILKDLKDFVYKFSLTDEPKKFEVEI
jgi:hypothetical protein